MKKNMTVFIMGMPYMILLVLGYWIIKMNNIFYSAMSIIFSMVLFLILQKLSIALLLVMRDKENLRRAVRLVFDLK